MLRRVRPTESTARFFHENIKRAATKNPAFCKTIYIGSHSELVLMSIPPGASLGEETHELLEVFRDLATQNVDILTIGQYLRPSKDHLPVARLYTPDEFRFLKEESLKMGFRHVESGPLVRSSYHADEQADAGRQIA